MLEEKLVDLLTPLIETQQAELYDVRWKSGLLSIVVDKEGGVSTDVLAKLNRFLSPLLEQSELIKSEYRLEVTSPGVERSLRTLAHYEKAVGESVIVKKPSAQSPNRFQGVVQAVDADKVILEVSEVDGTELKVKENVEIALSDIVQAKTVFDWQKSLGTSSKSQNHLVSPDNWQEQAKSKRKNKKSKSKKSNRKTTKEVAK